MNPRRIQRIFRHIHKPEPIRQPFTSTDHLLTLESKIGAGNLPEELRVY